MASEFIRSRCVVFESWLIERIAMHCYCHFFMMVVDVEIEVEAVAESIKFHPRDDGIRIWSNQQLLKMLRLYCHKFVYTNDHEFHCTFYYIIIFTFLNSLPTS